MGTSIKCKSPSRSSWDILFMNKILHLHFETFSKLSQNSLRHVLLCGARTARLSSPPSSIGLLLTPALLTFSRTCRKLRRQTVAQMELIEMRLKVEVRQRAGRVDEGACCSGEGEVCVFTPVGDTGNRFYKLGRILELCCVWPQM